MEATNATAPVIHVANRLPRHAAIQNLPQRWITIKTKKFTTRIQIIRFVLYWSKTSCYIFNTNNTRRLSNNNIILRNNNNNNNNNEGNNINFIINNYNEHKKDATYFIDEGGYGEMGAKGAATILNAQSKDYNTKDYITIIAAVGTGTMLAGLINAAAPHQNVMGIPILKNEASIEAEIKTLLKDRTKPFTLVHGFHQGGYAKTNPALFDFMNQLWTLEKIPTDIVYTGKLLWAVDSLLKQNYFKEGSKILVIHSGGLQGNRSLPLGTLLY